MLLYFKESSIMIRILSFILIVVWIIVMIISKYNLSKSRKIDRSHVAKRYIVRILSVIAISSAIYLILSPQIAGTKVTFKLFSLLIVWFLCVAGGIKFLFDTLGPVLSKNFVSKLNSNNYAVYLRSFEGERNHIYNSVENKLSNFLKTGIPMFAIGDPCEVISCVGAERLYASDGDWEEMVVNLISHAKLVIIRPSKSNGCLIELNHIEKLKILNKCMFIVTSKSEVAIIRNHLNIPDSSDLELFERNISDDKVYGIKIEASGKFSSFEFSASDENLSNFAILYGIDINSKAKPIRLSLWQHMLDRIAFVLNPLFYSSLFEWGLFQMILVTVLMACPLVVLKFYSHGMMTPAYSFILFTGFLCLFISLLCRTSSISLSNNQFASANHYMSRVKFLFVFNVIFLIAFGFVLFSDLTFRASMVDVTTMIGKMVLAIVLAFGQMIEMLWLLIKIMWLFIKFIWPLFIILGLGVSFILWRKYKKSKNDKFNN